MTREEAIEILELETRQKALSHYIDRPLGEMLDAIVEASRMGASALRAQPAKLDRSRWEGCNHCDDGCCCSCKYSITRQNFYPCRDCNMGSMYDP